MALDDVKIPYEILMRFGRDADGNTTVAAQQQYLRRITLDGELIKEEITPPEELGLGDFPTSEVMTRIHVDAVAQATKYLAEAKLLEQKLIQREAELRSAWQEEVNKMSLTLQSFASDARAKNETIEILKATIESLRPVGQPA